MDDAAEPFGGGRRSRVLHIIVHLSAGGAELMLKRLILHRNFDRAFEHRVISLRGLGPVGQDLRASGVHVVALGLNNPFQLPHRLARLITLIRGWRPDIVQTWMYHADLLGGIAARLAGIRKIVWNVRIAEISPRYGVARTTTWIMKVCALLSGLIPSRIIYVAHSARRVHEAAGYDPAKSVTIPNGYAVDSDVGAQSLGALHDLLTLPREVMLLGSAGRFNPQKNHAAFIAACGAIAARHPQWRFVLFGTGVDPGNAALASWIAATGYPERFHLLGERRDLPLLMPELDLFCMHSLSEGFPNVVAEAMGAGVPCVVTDVGDAARLVDDTGWTMPTADPAALTVALDEILSLDPRLRRDYGSRARKRIEGHYSMPAVVDRYIALYREVAADDEQIPGRV